jgi:hypothetical protein
MCTILWFYLLNKINLRQDLMETNFQKSSGEQCFSLIDEYAPGFSSLLVAGHDMLTPPDLEREVGPTAGKLFPIHDRSFLQIFYFILFYFIFPIKEV